ncbi:MAG: Amuc_1101 family PilM-like pilus complex protein [Verrucomicrobiales bacterium]
MADKKSILTLTLGSQRLGMARFAAGGKGALQLTQYAFAEIGGDPTTDVARMPQVASAVKNLATQFKASGSEVYYAISGQPVLSKFIKLPPLDLEKVDELIGFEAQQSIPWPISEVVWDHQVLNKEGGIGEIEAVLVAIKADLLAEMNDAVESAPLAAALVDVAPLALYNSFRYNYPEAAAPTLLIDLGARTVNLLYVEGNGKLFFRSLQNAGGAAISTSISKEFSIEFADAEGRKTTDGFVALSGYADHEDPELAALSKVIRNALTRTHGEIVRTTNLYRTQQGGSPPEHVYLCGGAASMHYVKEFFEEKLNLPVEFFNPLRNVTVGPKVNAEQAAHDAHSLGELVGLALRPILACPMEIDLVPPVVGQRRSNAERRPFLFAAAACLFGLLIASALYHRAAASGLEAKREVLEEKRAQLQGVANQIAEEDARAKREQARSEYLANAVQDRTYWLELCRELNTLMKNDLIWITQLQPTVGDPAKSISEPLGGDPKTITFDDSLKPEARAAAKPPVAGQPVVAPLIDGVHLFGLYREDQSGQGTQAVTDYFNEIKSKSRLFDIDPAIETAKYLKVDSASGDLWAYGFEMRLPLKRKLKAVTVTK